MVSHSPAVAPMCSVPRASERDVDLALAHALTACPEFAAWFIRSLGRADAARVVRVDISAFDVEGRETDLSVAFESPSGPGVLLVENKVDAEFQPYQARDYARRALAHSGSGSAVLVAPAEYLRQHASEEWHATLSYEAIREALRTLAPSHVTALTDAVLVSGLERHRTKDATLVDHDVTTFWRAYVTHVGAALPEMRAGGDTKGRGRGSDWATWNVAGVHERVRFVHKMAEGRIDLQLAAAGEQVEELKQAFSAILGPYEVLPATGSASVVARTRGLDRTRPFDEQRAAADDAIGQIRHLVSWYFEHRDVIHRALHANERRSNSPI